MFAEFIGKIKGKDAFYYRMSLTSSSFAAVALGLAVYFMTTEEYKQQYSIFAVIFMTIPVISGLLFLFCDNRRVYLSFIVMMFIVIIYYILGSVSNSRDNIRAALGIFPQIFAIVSLKFIYFSKFVKRKDNLPMFSIVFSVVAVEICVCALSALYVHNGGFLSNSFSNIFMGKYWYFFSCYFVIFSLIIAYKLMEKHKAISLPLVNALIKRFFFISSFVVVGFMTGIRLGGGTHSKIESLLGSFVSSVLLCSYFISVNEQLYSGEWKILKHALSGLWLSFCAMALLIG